MEELKSESTLKQGLILFGVILLLACSTVFFATKSYRSNQVLTLQSQLAARISVFNQTETILQQVRWSNEGANYLRNLGYRVVAADAAGDSTDAN